MTPCEKQQTGPGPGTPPPVSSLSSPSSVLYTPVPHAVHHALQHVLGSEHEGTHDDRDLGHRGHAARDHSPPAPILASPEPVHGRRFAGITVQVGCLDSRVYRSDFFGRIEQDSLS